jgi:SPP1 gp7 family putative phage head morphogenesis protein
MMRRKKKKIIKQQTVRKSLTAIERQYTRDIISLYKKEFKNIVDDIIAFIEKIGLETERFDAKEKKPNKKDIKEKRLRTVKDIIREFGRFRVAADSIVDPKRAGVVAQKSFNKTGKFAVDLVDEQIRGVVSIKPSELTFNYKPFVKENVDLIVTIPRSQFDKIEKAVIDRWTTGVTTKSLVKDIKQLYNVSDYRAKLIAIDQIGKVNQQITQKRHEEIGVDRYIWSTSLDERVRGNPTGKYPIVKHSHWEREGKIFFYNDPPEDGHPGFAIRCRCVAIPYLERLIDNDNDFSA